MCVPHLQRKEMVFRRARGGLWSGLFHLLSLESVFYSGASRGVGALGREGSSLVILLSLDGLFIKCRLWGRKGPLEGTPRGPRPGRGEGSAGALNLWRGSSGKAPSLFKYPPTYKSGRRKRGESALVNSNVPRTLGGRFVNNLPFSVARPAGFAPPPHHHANRSLSKKPLKSDLGFCRLISSPSSVFLFSLPLGHPLRTLLAPSPPFCPALPLLSPREVRAPFRHPRGPALHNSLNNHVLQALGRAGDLSPGGLGGGRGCGLRSLLAAPLSQVPATPPAAPSHPSPVPAWECLSPGVVIKWG